MLTDNDIITIQHLGCTRNSRRLVGRLRQERDLVCTECGEMLEDHLPILEKLTREHSPGRPVRLWLRRLGG